MVWSFDVLDNGFIGTDYTHNEINGERFNKNLPVYILTSGRTGSVAEAFTYVLKHSNRATFIGEVTKGMAHTSIELIVNDYFRVSAPFRRSENSYTKTNWERVGVIPHIKEIL